MNRFHHIDAEVIQNHDKNWHKEKDTELKATWVRGNNFR